MNGQKQKFSELKKQAREAMAGRCGTLVGATAINLFLTPDRRFSGVLSGARHLFRVYFKNSDGLLQHPHRRRVSGSDPRRLSAEPQCPV